MALPPPFLRLPNEIITAIFAYTYDDTDESPEVPYTAVCRRLQPFFTSALLRYPEFHSTRKLRRFYEHLQRYPEHAAGVQTMLLRTTFHDSDRPFMRADLWDVDGEEDESPEPEPSFAPQFDDLCAKLVGLRCLVIREVSLDLEDSVFFGTALPNLVGLEELVIHDYPFDKEGDAEYGMRTRASFLERLSTLDNLRTLRFICSRRTLPLPQASHPFTACPQITTFEIEHLSLPQYWPLNFAALFPNLRTFIAQDMQGTNRLSSHVVTLPETLRVFHAFREPPVDEDVASHAWDDLLQYIPRFPLLESLHLCHGAFQPEQLLPSLRSAARIRRIGFDLASPLSDIVLREILRLPQLARLTLDHVETRVGRPCMNFHDGPEVDAPPLRPSEWSWIEPDWPPGGSREGLKAALALATDRGIVLDGSALEVEHFYELWRREQLSVAVERGVQKEDWSLVGELGFSWREVSEYMAQAWREEREDFRIKPPRYAHPRANSHYSDWSL